MVEITVQIPYNFQLSSLGTFLRGVFDEHNDPRAERIKFDFARMAFIQGEGITAFCNTIEWLERNGVSCSFMNYEHGRPAVRYLDDCGFFAEYLGRPLAERAAVRNTTVPFRKIAHEHSHEWLVGTLCPWLQARLNLTEASFGGLSQCIREIFNNVQEHSTENIACVHTQWFPNVDRIHVTISDFGVGIPSTIRQKYEVSSDAHAIRWAMNEGVSTKPSMAHKGVGLDYLNRYVVTCNGGSVAIHSHRGGVSCSPQYGKIRYAPWMGSGYYPGTLVHIVFRTDTIEAEPDEREDLEW